MMVSVIGLVIEGRRFVMGKNKRAQFFGIYLVLLTLLMCGTVILLYTQQANNAKSELVSPRDVLDIVDGLDVFEMKEVELIKGSYDKDVRKFRENFFSGMGEGMKEFIKEDVDKAGVDGFFENVLYPESLTYVEGDKLYFGRAKVVKQSMLKPLVRTKNYFPVGFVFEFEKSYVVSKVGGEVKVEVVE